jgi:ParB-like chromosome segregation protein Spo0J
MMNYKIEVIDLPLNKLKPHPKNSKLHPKGQVRKIAQSIKDYGFNNPILIDSSNTIIAGHGRWQACKLLKLESVPTICLGHLSTTQVRAYLIADNKVSESGYDIKVLCDELFELSRAGYDSLQLGLDENEMNKLMAESNASDEEEQDLDEIAGNLVATSGQVWDLEGHKIHVGGRRLNLKKICKFLEESKKPLTLFLAERQAQSLISYAEANNKEVTNEVGF